MAPVSIVKDRSPKQRKDRNGGIMNQSLLVQQLQYPFNDTINEDSFTPFSSLTQINSSGALTYTDPIIPVHSDFTVPTSNVSPLTPEFLSNGIHQQHQQHQHGRRPVFGGKVEKKYGVRSPRIATTSAKKAAPAPIPINSGTSPALLHSTPGMDEQDSWDNEDEQETNGIISHRAELCDLAQPSQQHRSTSSSIKKKKRKPPVHETLHAQSLVLGFAFMAIWSPQNCMAPNLTEMASDFHFSEAQRDSLLGATLAIATGVLSLPISAGIGILADVMNRKYLFCLTVALGGVSSYLTGASRTYRALFIARLLNGAFMSGSVPVAFSLLGDLFDTNERNAASSGLTAMMGLGMILGQVYAGVVGSSEGWPHPFYVSAVITLVSAVLVLLLVKEPIRGGKEEVLQNMLKHGTRYERKLTWQAFVQTMRNNESNMIIMWQGFFSSVPWGIIFVFLNDYLSQERGFSVPDATYLVAVFGAGCAVGGVLGGYWGQVFQSMNRSYLPLFMAATTFLAIFPFVGLLNSKFTNAHGLWAITYAFFGGLIASLPSVCVRPCLINVNPPETRGAALTAANLIIQLARGAGPSFITILTAFQVDRQTSFNITVRVRCFDDAHNNPKTDNLLSLRS